MKATNINWETDGEITDLPEEVFIDVPIDEDEVADWLSDTYGWLVDSFSIEYDDIQSIDLYMQDWTNSYPTGAIINYSEGEEFSEFCDSVEEYKEFLRNRRKEILDSKPRVIVLLDADDVGTSTVIDAAKEIRDFIKDGLPDES